ncbi:replication initiation protein [Trueperella pyogenes]
MDILANPDASGPPVALRVESEADLKSGRRALTKYDLDLIDWWEDTNEFLTEATFGVEKQLTLSLIEKQPVQPASGYVGDYLTDSPWSTWDALAFLAQFGRKKIHASIDRDFAKASIRRLCSKCREKTARNTTKKRLDSCETPGCGQTIPRLYPRDRLGDKQYINLFHKKRRAFLTVDIDSIGTPGGGVANLAPGILDLLNTMAADGHAPNWIGINPAKGKAQVIWYLDPVYTDGDPTKPNRPLKFLTALQGDVNAMFSGDRAFAHSFMRNPLYIGDDPNAYVWHCYHHAQHHMRDLAKEVVKLTGHTSTGIDTTNAPAPEKTGWDVIEQAKANRKKAEFWRSYAQELDGMSVDELEAIDPSLDQGVRVLYSETEKGKVLRDETAFRYALKIGYRLRKNGDRLSDNPIIDAYLHAYDIAQKHDKTGRPADRPPHRDLLTLARRIRGYVSNNSTTSSRGHGYDTTGTRVTPQERSALRTFGRRGGTTSAERKWADRNNPEAQKVLDGLEQANRRRSAAAKTSKAEVLAYLTRQQYESGETPTRREVMNEFNVSESTAKRYIRAVRDLL